MLDLNEKEGSESNCARIKHLIKKILESEIEVMVMASLAIIGLFASDFRTMLVDKKYDIVFIVLYIFFL